MEDNTLFEQLGGRGALEKVHKLFYDKIYSHSWLKDFFGHIEQKLIEDQQTDFMTSNMGGGKIYSGALPRNAHKHMFISDDLFDVRKSLLQESLAECGIRDDLAERWIRIDEAFRHSLVKKNIDECEKRYNTDEIVHIPKPANF